MEEDIVLEGGERLLGLYITVWQERSIAHNGTMKATLTRHHHHVRVVVTKDQSG